MNVKVVEIECGAIYGSCGDGGNMIMMVVNSRGGDKSGNEFWWKWC